MKHIFTILCFLLLQNCIKINTKEVQENFYDNNDLQFTFIVFDNKKLDNFFEDYKSFDFENEKIKKDLKNLTQENFIFQNSVLNKYSKNTKTIEKTNSNLAKKVITATLNGNREYWKGSLDYLLFNKTLPDKFQQKWIQTHLGNFQFNISFLALLREKNKMFDDLIYGNIYKNDKRLEQFNSEYITNEITPEIAQNLKNTIQTDKNFQDARFLKDREIFLEFLDKAIQKEWKMILLDWN